jgi:CheY-like chemotaxis protein
MAPVKVLVVDDEPALRDVLTILFEDEGYDVITARNGAEALAAVASMRPTIVVTDIMMPVMDGIALCHALAADPATATLPVVMFSAGRNDPRLEGLPIAAFLPKPMNFATLLQIVDALTDGMTTAI